MASISSAERMLRLRVTSPRLVARDGGPTEFGLQDHQLHLKPGQPAAHGLLAFDFAVRVVHHPADGSVRYRGPFVFGTWREPYLYLSVRPVGGDPAAWCRRVKVRFPILTWEEVAALPESAILAADVSGERSRAAPLHVYEWTRRD